MTAFACDGILIEGQRWLLRGAPLVEALRARGWGTVMTSTANSHGHTAEWAIVDDRLVLLRAHGKVELPAVPGEVPDVDEITGWTHRREIVELRLEDVFGQPPPIEATWVSGSLWVVGGEVTKYVHMGYESEYEHEGWITVEAGRVTKIDLLAAERRRERDGRLVTAPRRPPRWKFWVKRPPSPWTCRHGHLVEAERRYCPVCGYGKGD